DPVAASVGPRMEPQRVRQRPSFHSPTPRVDTSTHSRPRLLASKDLSLAGSECLSRPPANLASIPAFQPPSPVAHVHDARNLHRAHPADLRLPQSPPSLHLPIRLEPCHRPYNHSSNLRYHYLHHRAHRRLG